MYSKVVVDGKDITELLYLDHNADVRGGGIPAQLTLYPYADKAGQVERAFMGGDVVLEVYGDTGQKGMPLRVRLFEIGKQAVRHGWHEIVEFQLKVLGRA